MTRTAREGAARARPTQLLRAAGPRSSSAHAALHAPQPASTVAWLVAIPCALLTAAIVAFLGPPVADVLYPAHGHFGFLPGEGRYLSPEGVENTRYLLVWSAPLLLAASTVLVLRRWRPEATRTSAVAVAAVQVAGAAFVLVCVVAQHAPRWSTPYFNGRSLVAAALIGAAVAVVAFVPRLRALAARMLRETRLRRVVATVIALVATVVWVLPGINTETSIAWTFASHDMGFQIDETFTVLNGLTPLTDFDAQYASLLPYLIATSLLAFGKTLLTFTITIGALTTLSFMAMFGMLRRAGGSSVAALLLFVPVLATGLFTVSGAEPVRFTFATYFPMFPLRFVGPCVLAWLLAWQLGRARQMPTWAIGIAAGLVLLNNVEFGLVACVATAAALAATLGEHSPRALLRLAGQLGLGVGATIVAFTVFSLIRAGALPNVGRMLVYSRLYTSAGYSNFPLDGVVGLQLVILATYVAAIGTATARAVAQAENRVLTALLIWVGIFGLGSASYYVVRSGAVILPQTFAMWSLALALLTIAALAQPRRLPGLATLALLFGIGTSATSIALLPTPAEQLGRMQAPPPGIAFRVDRSQLTAAIQPTRDPQVREFVSSLADGPDRFATRAGAPIALFATQGHRIADAYGVVDVVPYTGPESIHTADQLEDSLDALREAGGNTALVARRDVWRFRAVLSGRDFALLMQDGLRTVRPGARIPWRDVLVVDGLTKWVDMHRLHPPALARS